MILCRKETTSSKTNKQTNASRVSYPQGQNMQVYRLRGQMFGCTEVQNQFGIPCFWQLCSPANITQSDQTVEFYLTSETRSALKASHHSSKRIIQRCSQPSRGTRLHTLQRNENMQESRACFLRTRNLGTYQVFMTPGNA